MGLALGGVNCEAEVDSMGWLRDKSQSRSHAHQCVEKASHERIRWRPRDLAGLNDHDKVLLCQLMLKAHPAQPIAVILAIAAFDACRLHCAPLRNVDLDTRHTLHIPRRQVTQCVLTGNHFTSLLLCPKSSSSDSRKCSASTSTSALHMTQTTLRVRDISNAKCRDRY